jgi:hypothetical protein
MEEGLEDSCEVPTCIRTYLYLHLFFVKTTIDIRVLNDFELNFRRLGHRKGIERCHLACHVV